MPKQFPIKKWEKFIFLKASQRWNIQSKCLFMFCCQLFCVVLFFNSVAGAESKGRKMRRRGLANWSYLPVCERDKKCLYEVSLRDVFIIVSHRKYCLATVRVKMTKILQFKCIHFLTIFNKITFYDSSHAHKELYQDVKWKISSESISQLMTIVFESNRSERKFTADKINLEIIKNAHFHNTWWWLRAELLSDSPFIAPHFSHIFRHKCFQSFWSDFFFPINENIFLFLFLAPEWCSSLLGKRKSTASTKEKNVGNVKRMCRSQKSREKGL